MNGHVYKTNCDSERSLNQSKHKKQEDEKVLKLFKTALDQSNQRTNKKLRT